MQTTDELALFFKPPRLSRWSPSDEADRQRRGRLRPAERHGGGQQYERDTRCLRPNGSRRLTWLSRPRRPRRVSCLIITWIYLSVSSLPLPMFPSFFWWSWKRRLCSVVWLAFRAFARDAIFHISPLSVLSFSELFWRTVRTVGLCQEGWEPYEEPIWEYYCMCVQSTSSVFMNICVPFPFFRMIYWPGLWLWITMSCSNGVLLSANESCSDLSNLLLYASYCSVFAVMRNQLHSVWHVACSPSHVYNNLDFDLAITSY